MVLGHPSRSTLSTPPITSRISTQQTTRHRRRGRAGRETPGTTSGETGCGKTTQVPQFVIDDMDSRGEGAHCSIICTQPRRISAISVAERVSSERCQPLGLSVGYQIRLEAKRSDETRLLFCTTG